MEQLATLVGAVESAVRHVSVASLVKYRPAPRPVPDQPWNPRRTEGYSLAQLALQVFLEAAELAGDDLVGSPPLTNIAGLYGGNVRETMSHSACFLIQFANALVAFSLPACKTSLQCPSVSTHCLTTEAA